jgi:hypothetical protein
MPRLINILCALLLLASLASGGFAHAMEIGGQGEVTAATEWLHADGDHDQVPADADKDYPHHHHACQGHDLGAPLVANLAVEWLSVPADLSARGNVILRGAIARRDLRPPIA